MASISFIQSIFLLLIVISQIFYFIFQFIVRVVPCVAVLLSLISSFRINKICLMQLAADMQRFSRPERRINGPTTTHLWCAACIIFSDYLLDLSLDLRYQWQFGHYFRLLQHRVTSCMIIPHLLTSLVFLSGQCWSYLMYWFNLTILKMPRPAYPMIFPGIKGMGIISFAPLRCKPLHAVRGQIISFLNS